MERNFNLVRRSLLLSISIFLLSLPVMAIFLPSLSLYHGSIMLLVAGLVPSSILAFMCIGIDTDEYSDTEILDDAFFDRILQEAEQNPVKYKARLRRHLMLGRLYLLVLVISLIEGCVGVILLGQTLFIPTIILFSGVVGTGLIIYLIFRSLLYRPNFPQSPEVLIATTETFPKLIELATATQQMVNAPSIHHIYIVPGDNCAVQLHSDFFGIRKKNIMEIGLDLLMFMDDEELTALFAHELSHIRKKDTLLGYQVMISLIRWVIVGANAENRHYTVRYLLGKFAGYQAASLDFLMKAVRKPQEVEADKLAAEVAGEETAIRFLLKSLAMRQVPAAPIDFFNITEPDQLPSKPYTQSLSNTRQFSQGNGSDDGLIHLDIPEEYSGPKDSHPSVYERLVALGWNGTPKSMVLQPRETLDPGFGAALAFFDENWAESLMQDWEDFEESAEEDDETIESYDGSMEDGDTCMGYGWALFRRRRWQEALEHFQKISGEFNDPDDLVVHAMISCRLRLGDESAIKELIQLTDNHPELIEDTFDEINIFIKNTGKVELWQSLNGWMQEKAQIYREYKRELGELRGRDVLIGASIPGNRILKPLRARLYQLRRIKSIILMRKDVQYAAKGPLIVGIDVGFGTTTSKDVQQVTDIFEEFMPQLPYEGLIVRTYEQDPRFFLREFLGDKGSLAYNRRLYKRSLKKDGGLTEEELLLRKRVRANNYKMKLRNSMQQNEAVEAEADTSEES